MFTTSYTPLNMRVALIFALFVGIFQVAPIQAKSPISLGWAKRIGGTLADSGSDIALDGNGNIYSIGGFYGTVDFDPGTGSAAFE